MMPEVGLALVAGVGVGVGRGVGGAVGGGTEDAAWGGWIAGPTGRSAALTSAGSPGCPPLTGYGAASRSM